MSIGRSQKMATIVWPAHLNSLIDTGSYSDCTIRCQGREFRVHKAIICPQSPVLAAAINGNFKEAQSNVVEIEAFDLDVSETMIHFMYGKKTGILGSESSCDQQMSDETDTEDSVPTGKPPRSDLHDLMRLSTIADYYDVATMRAQVNLEIRAVLSKAWVPTDFIAAAKMAYAATRDVEQHNVFAEFAARNMESLWIHFDNFVELFQLPGFVTEFKKQSGNLFKPTATELQLLRTFAADMQSAFNGRQRRYTTLGQYVAFNDKLTNIVRKFKANKSRKCTEALPPHPPSLRVVED